MSNTTHTKKYIYIYERTGCCTEKKKQKRKEISLCIAEVSELILVL